MISLKSLNSFKRSFFRILKDVYWKFRGGVDRRCSKIKNEFQRKKLHRKIRSKSAKIFCDFSLIGGSTASAHLLLKRPPKRALSARVIKFYWNIHRGQNVKITLISLRKLYRPLPEEPTIPQLQAKVRIDIKLWLKNGTSYKIESFRNSFQIQDGKPKSSYMKIGSLNLKQQETRAKVRIKRMRLIFML